MGDLQLSDILLAKLAGWEVVKQARGLVAAGRVLSSEWQPPNLWGTVQEGTAREGTAQTLWDVLMQDDET